MAPTGTNTVKSAAATPSASNSSMAHAPFLKNLAANERPTRDKAVAALRTYLSSRRQHTHRDFLHLWKGLFYCMWHSDRPRPQQLLAADLADLITPLPSATAWMFWDAFWQTVIREWNGIDVLRMDKFLMLVRREVNAGMRYCKKAGWREEDVAEMVRIVKEGPMHPTEKKVPNGIRYHLCDIWVDELEKVREKGETAPWEELVSPFVEMKKEGGQKLWRTKAGAVMVDGRWAAWKEGKEFGEEEEKAEEEDKMDETEDKPESDDDEEGEFMGFD